MKKLQGCIIGNHSIKNNASLIFAEETGKLLAKLGIILICGGKGGIMEAACKGSYENNGTTVCILPETNFEAANPYCSIVIPTGIGYARNLTNVLSGDFIVALGGGTGTLSELAYAWQFDKPIYSVTLFEGWAKNLAGKKIDENYNQTIIPVSSLKQLEEYLINDFNL